MTRRDKCFLVGRRAVKLSREEAATAWFVLAEKLELLGDADVPKFKDLLHCIRKATIEARNG